MNLDQLNESGDLFSDMLYDPDEGYLVTNSVASATPDNYTTNDKEPTQ